MKTKKDRENKRNKGLTLVELVTTVAILGSLSSIIYPGLIRHLRKAKQQGCAATMSQVMVTTLNYYDENQVEPTGWRDISNIAALMTIDGPAMDEDFKQLTINDDYYFGREGTSDTYRYYCTPTDTSQENYNVDGCLRLINGAIQINLGDYSSKAKTAVCS